ncbi:type VI secretion system baseplate subunit TssF [Pseudomonas sp. FEN]|uniref:type VI secretion system baseplate subunit TssF n=1 Tax=Pseudomonas sp. FEN TaxID=2767468 RepID=UPI00174DB917|nr:type VI secretion system baseplate subunit TssF [Pseudomonas sp. FEN]
MSDSIDARLLDYYQRELTWLYRAGSEFADNHPTLANSLKLSSNGSQDPHVERLIESFALLAARLQRRLDDGYSEFTDALLEQLYPMALRPMPSCAIVQFGPDPTKGSLAAGYRLPRDMQVFKAPEKEQLDSLYFRTCAEVTLWPVEVQEVSLLEGSAAQLATGIANAEAALCLTLKCNGEKTWSELPIQTLRIHLAGPAGNRARLYDLLAAHSLDIVCGLPDSPGQAINARPLAVGFDDAQRLLPEEDGVHPGLRLLVEYFAFPEKFAFFDLALRIPPLATDLIEVYIAFDRVPESRISLQREDIALGCTPVINLFPRTAETLRPDGTQSEYRLVADSHRDNSVEIHSIRKLVAGTPDGFHNVPSYYGYQHGQEQGGLFWHARRISATTPSRPGTDLMLSLVDSQFQPRSSAPGETFTAQVWCTNRHMAQNLLTGSALKFERSGPVATITLLKSPTPQSLPDLEGASRWRLISQLNLNHLSLTEGPGALEALREMLILHNLRDEPAARLQINGILALRTERVVGRVGKDAWRGWRNGLEVRLELDPSKFSGSSRVLFSGVLAHFFALYANANCFVRTLLVEGDKEIKLWSPSSSPILAL